MSATALMVIPTQVRDSLEQIIEHLEALFDTYDLTAAGSEERAEIESEIARWIEAECRKVDGIAGYLAHCENQQEFAAEEIRRLKLRCDRYEARQEKTEERVIALLQMFGRVKIEGRTATLILRRNPP